MSTPCQHDTWTELAVRENDGLAVSLLWSRTTGRVEVRVVDAQRGDKFEFSVAGADALAAFNHPFAYAAGLGVSRGNAGSRPRPGLATERNAVS